MKLYRLYYRVIGGVILVVGMLLVPFLPRLIAEDVPANINIYYRVFWLTQKKDMIF